MMHPLCILLLRIPHANRAARGAQFFIDIRTRHAAVGVSGAFSYHCCSHEERSILYLVLYYTAFACMYARIQASTVTMLLRCCTQEFAVSNYSIVGSAISLISLDGISILSPVLRSHISTSFRLPDFLISTLISAGSSILNFMWEYLS